MSGSYRLPIFAIIGLIALCSVGALAQPPNVIANPDRQESATEGKGYPAAEDQATRESPQPTAKSDLVEAKGDDKIASKDKPYPDCEFSSVSECDLAAQQSMAESTEYMNAAAWAGIMLTVVGLGLLFRTMLYTGEAAKYAKTAAEAAVESVREARKATIAAVQATDATKKIVKETRRQTDVAERSAEFSRQSVNRLERPYLYVQPMDWKFSNVDGGKQLRLKYKLVNHGRTPATLLESNVRLELKPKFPLRLPMQNKVRHSRVIPPSNERVFDTNLENWTGTPAIDGNTRQYLVFHGSLSYDDPTGALHIDRFCFRVDNSGIPILEGGVEYNYRTTKYHDQEEKS